VEGFNNLYLGFSAQPTTTTSCNEVVFGNASVDCIRAAVQTITALSDARDKTNVQPIDAGLEFIKNLRPVKFTWNTRDGAKSNIADAGFIAQEAASAEEKFNTASWLKLVDHTNPDRLQMAYGKLVPVLVKAVQELAADLEATKAELADLKSRIDGS
jgi:hypothetical protein